MKASRLVLAAAVVAVSAGLAVSTARAQGVNVPPALMVEENGTSVPLKITNVSVEARILGPLAETKMTMTFHNSHNRALAGELYFPLPQGATVSGYALDIQGKLVDGVVVEKDKGRQVLEKEMRKGVDPGLVEWTKGNNFRTRVFPIPANGSRTVMVQYVSELPPSATPTWRLPLNFRDKVGTFSLRVEVVRGTEKPRVIRGGPEGLEFAAWQDGFRAEKTVQNAALAKDLIVELPAVEKQKVLVEKAPDGEVYFAINDSPPAPAPGSPEAAGGAAAGGVESPKNIAILYDASGSREHADRKRELDLLRKYLAGKTLGVDLVVFRNADQPLKHLDVANGDASALIKEIESQPLDGGTQLGCISRPLGSVQPDLYLLFTDGISNFGREEVVGLRAPVYALCGSTSANHTLLDAVCSATGGQYFNLARLDDAAVLAAIGKPAFSFLSATIDGKESMPEADVTWPCQVQAVQGRFILAGRLEDRTRPVKVVLTYGVGGKVRGQTSYDVSPGSAGEGAILRRLWAQKKVEQLMARPQANEDQIVATGKKYGLVTPGTSLIVLENLDQYVAHEIVPPRTLPEMRDKYMAILDAKAADKKKEDASKLDRVLAMWNERVKWWATDFKYPKNFKFREAAGGEGGPGSPTTQPANGERRFAPGLAAAEAAPMPAPRPAMAPATTAPPRANAGGQGGGTGRGLFDTESAGARSGKDAADPGAAERRGEPGVVIKEWDPKTPYLAALKKAAPDQAYSVYLAQRAKYDKSPAFFLDCGDFFLKQGQGEIGLRVLSNIAELELENAALLRVLAYKLAQSGELDLAIDLFEDAKRMRPEEPQSYRDLGLALAKRAARDYAALAAMRLTEAGYHQRIEHVLGDYRRSLDLLAKVVMNQWDRFEEIELIALMEFNQIWAKIGREVGESNLVAPLDSRLIKLLDLDVRIVLTWDADMTDIDLHVVEPSGERAYYGHNRTTIGGLVSKDFTQGYGPEEYLVHRAMGGMYRIEANYFGSSAATVQGPVTVQAEVITNFGRANEKRQSLTLRLTEKKETFLIGEIEY